MRRAPFEISPAIADYERAMTLWQPWASAIVLGTKAIENRPKPPPRNLIGRIFWVHAGLRYDKERHSQVLKLWPELEVHHPTLPLGAIVGCARIVGVISARDVDRSFLGDSLSHVVSIPTPGMIAAYRCDPWFMGPFGYLLVERRALTEPVLCRGFQGAWTVPKEVREAALARLVSLVMQ